MNKPQTQSNIDLKIMETLLKDSPDLELDNIIDDQTIDNELNYQLVKDDLLPDDEDSINKETIGRISATDLF